MNKVENKGQIEGYVYDISLDGTVVNALGCNIISNTDGFNFQMPENQMFRYTDEHPYISQGLGRNYPKGKAFTKVDADVAEFEDLFLNEKYASGPQKMGLGVDEYVPRSINFSRKNYADLLDEKTREIKLVGNTIKSKKMPIYIEKFLDEGLMYLLFDEGKKFLELYYDYIEKIYNMRIPLREIASIGKIKTSIETYKENCKQLTKGGTKKSRQAWYELAIKDKLDVHMGDAIYYINTGTKKTESDVKRVTRYFFKNSKGEKIYTVCNVDGSPKLDKRGNPIDLTKDIEKAYTATYKGWKVKLQGNKPTKISFARERYPNLNIEEEDKIYFNCIRLPNEIVDDEEVEHYCDEDFEYNRDKYIDAFNKRVKPLLVCFDKKIRMRVNDRGKEVNNILITSPEDRKTFTEEECKLVNGQPYHSTDQDTYGQLMTMEDKEIRFWLEVGKKPLFCDECGMDWEQIKVDYYEHQAKLQEEGVREELELYNAIIDKMSYENVVEFLEDGVLPEKLLQLVDEDIENNAFTSKKFGVILGTIRDIIDKFDEGLIDVEVDE